MYKHNKRKRIFLRFDCFYYSNCIKLQMLSDSWKAHSPHSSEINPKAVLKVKDWIKSQIYNKRYFSLERSHLSIIFHSDSTLELILSIDSEVKHRTYIIRA